MELFHLFRSRRHTPSRYLYMFLTTEWLHHAIIIFFHTSFCVCVIISLIYRLGQSLILRLNKRWAKRWGMPFIRFPSWSCSFILVYFISLCLFWCNKDKLSFLTPLLLNCYFHMNYFYTLKSSEEFLKSRHTYLLFTRLNNRKIK